MRRALMTAVLAGLAIAATVSAQQSGGRGCAPDNAGLALPPGFCASVFADTLRGARHLVVAPNGDVFVSRQAGRGRSGGILVLRELNHSGRADVIAPFATGFTSSEIALFDGHVYAEAFPPGARGRGGPSPTIAILRYPLRAGEMAPSGPPDTIVAGLPGRPGHSTRNFAITRDGAVFVNVGSGTNACQVADRQKASPGHNPCTELETRAGIWKFDARATHQTQATGVHLARGIRNAVGIAVSPLDGRLWATQHGRDNLGGPSGNWPFDAKYNAENPAEELVQVNQGDDFGWPYCYYSVIAHRLVQAPEYGGDGTKLGDCASKKGPVAVFPGHWAPNALMFYTGSAFPARYRNGAFIAFHGSWNRSPEPAGGYNVVFQPLKGGTADGPYEVFADGFSNATTGREGNHRPAGLAQGPDGALYVADDAGGRIYKIIYVGTR